jgi:hypothetical protein
MNDVEKTWDDKTNAKIQKLHPLLKPIASKFINEVEGIAKKEKFKIIKD